MMPLPKENLYTFADLLTWEDDKQYELIEGIPYLMAPAPSIEHQEIGGGIFAQVYSYLIGKSCKVLYSPVDVRLFEKQDDTPKKIDTVVQPDLVVVCDPKKLDKTGCKGAPDMVVEILSPSTQRHDRVTKFNLYEQAGVREYWIVDPANQTVHAFILENGRYITSAFGTPNDQLKVAVLDDCYVDLSKVFPT